MTVHKYNREKCVAMSLTFYRQQGKVMFLIMFVCLTGYVCLLLPTRGMYLLKGVSTGGMPTGGGPAIGAY